MGSRRDALRILTLGSVSLPVVSSTPQQNKEVESQPGHLHTGPTVKPPVPAKPTFFQPAEFGTVEAVSERIIPRTDTPGAKDAGVALLIDRAIMADPTVAQSFRAGIADLNALATGMYGSDFASLTEEQQIRVLTPLSFETNTPLGKFFAMVKDMTVDAYYKTEAGLRSELGWQGNTYLSEFPGCNHPEHQN